MIIMHYSLYCARRPPEPLACLPIVGRVEDRDDFSDDASTATTNAFSQKNQNNKSSQQPSGVAFDETLCVYLNCWLSNILGSSSFETTLQSNSPPPPAKELVHNYTVLA